MSDRWVTCVCSPRSSSAEEMRRRSLTAYCRLYPILRMADARLQTMEPSGARTLTASPGGLGSYRQLLKVTLRASLVEMAAAMTAVADLE